MTDRNEKDGTVLMAWVMVQLESGESFELLPFEDAQDVKSKVGDLMKDWARSGFLIRGKHIYPWHRVRLVEATKVEELSRDESKLRIEEWQATDRARMQQSFWKTKQAREKEESNEEDNESTPQPPRRVA
jgi:hypothetical protein